MEYQSRSAECNIPNPRSPSTTNNENPPIVTDETVAPSIKTSIKDQVNPDELDIKSEEEKPEPTEQNTDALLVNYSSPSISVLNNDSVVGYVFILKDFNSETKGGCSEAMAKVVEINENYEVMVKTETSPEIPNESDAINYIKQDIVHVEYKESSTTVPDNNCFKCAYCENKYKGTITHQRHMLTHTAQLPFKCRYCERSFFSAITLKQHRRSHKIFLKSQNKCADCNIKFKKSSTFERHMLTHTTQLPFKCKHCDRSFVREITLKQHLHSHKTLQKITRYKCTYCDEEFRTNNNLKYHVFKHNGERPYQCKVCDKAYILSDFLKRHMLSHSREWPHTCSHCGKEYVNATKLQCHIRSHEPPQPSSEMSEDIPNSTDVLNLVNEDIVKVEYK